MKKRNLHLTNLYDTIVKYRVTGEYTKVFVEPIDIVKGLQFDTCIEKTISLTIIHNFTVRRKVQISCKSLKKQKTKNKTKQKTSL